MMFGIDNLILAALAVCALIVVTMWEFKWKRGTETRQEFDLKNATLQLPGVGLVGISKVRMRPTGELTTRIIQRMKDVGIPLDKIKVIEGWVGKPYYEFRFLTEVGWTSPIPNTSCLITHPNQFNNACTVVAPEQKSELTGIIDELRKFNTLINTREQEITLNTTDNQSWTTRTMNHAGKIRKELGQVFLPMQDKGRGQYGSGEMPLPPGAQGGE